MGRITYGEAIQRLSERAYDNREDIEQKNKQRRNGLLDLYGIEYRRESDGTKPATMYISISPDFVYHERLMFKLIIEDTTASDFSFTMSGIDITPYLMAQQDGAWIEGEGVYPSDEGLQDDLNYDILQVAEDLLQEGREEDSNILLGSGYKKVEISSSSPFTVSLILYPKYSHVNR